MSQILKTPLRYEEMPSSTKKLRDFYALKPNADIYHTEFGFYVIDRWKREGHLSENITQEGLNQLFGFDSSARFSLGNLGWCEAAFLPVFEEKVLEIQGDYEIAQDFAGRHVKYFRNRRDGFMPEYVDHPVKDMKTWEETCLWRLDPKDPARAEPIQKAIEGATSAALEGKMIIANLVGGYMYLRSLMGPLEIMYLLYDNPDLIHACMQTWFDLSDSAIAEYQKHVTIDEVFFGEDICYNHGFLISEDMIREFLFPYYTQLLDNMRKRQLDKSRRLYFQLDTDGFSDPAIDLYQTLGMDYLSPFEVASGCDVVRTSKEYPELLIRGGIDKRILAKSKEAIDRELDRIIPFMKKRGGYIPTCDHGVPEEVSFENYMHYRKRMLEYSK